MTNITKLATTLIAFTLLMGILFPPQQYTEEVISCTEITRATTVHEIIIGQACTDGTINITRIQLDSQ